MNTHTRGPLPLLAVNHVSRVCSDLEASYRFYSEVLGFIPVKRPSSFEFEGAWLFNYGVGLHLIKGHPPERPSKIEPKACHISFQALSLEAVEECLIQQDIPYVKNVFMEDGIQIGQLFFHDPDNNMIEICNCEELPVVPLTEAALACAARPPLAAASPTARAKAAVAAAHPKLLREADLACSSSIDSGSSDSGCDDIPVAAATATTIADTARAVGAVPSVVAAAALRYSAVASDASFSHSSISGLTMTSSDGGAHAMSFTAGELDEWPSGLAGGLSAMSVGSRPSLDQCKASGLASGGEHEMVHV